MQGSESSLPCVSRIHLMARPGFERPFWEIRKDHFDVDSVAAGSEGYYQIDSYMFWGYLLKQGD